MGLQRGCDSWLYGVFRFFKKKIFLTYFFFFIVRLSKLMYSLNPKTSGQVMPF